MAVERPLVVAIKAFEEGRRAAIVGSTARETAMRRYIAAISLAVAPVVAVATIYKVEMPDGTILFTDAPPSNGKILETRESKSAPRPPVKAGSPATPVSPGAASGPVARPVPVLPSPERPAAPSTAVPRNLEAAAAEINAAERELTVARRKLEVGREPQPGERLGTAKGGSRLSPEYESRIADLEREVAAAEQRVKRAYETRNSLK
jgi:hypothetical protein